MNNSKKHLELMEMKRNNNNNNNMNIRKELRPLLIMGAVFLGFYYLPINWPRFSNAVFESLALARWYAREHVLLCLIPAFFIAGAISVFISSASVMKYLGAKASKITAYGIASVSGSVLAVCSCTVLPLFSGIYSMGAGLGPAIAFLYSGPAINVLAIILTARILGIRMGIARAVGAVVFSIVIGVLMHLFFRSEENIRAKKQMTQPQEETPRKLWQDIIYFAAMIGVLVFANWGVSQETSGIWYAIYSNKWIITSLFGGVLALTLGLWFSVSWWKLIIAAFAVLGTALVFPETESAAFIVGILMLSIITITGTAATESWFDASLGFAKQILPLLLIGVLIAGVLLGRPGSEGLIPSSWVSAAVGGNSLLSNFISSFLGAFMYFATLTEVPILQGLMGAGMGKGPALSLLLAGPALSLPNMLVIRSVLGTKKTVVFVILVVIIATVSGMIYGMI